MLIFHTIFGFCPPAIWLGTILLLIACWFIISDKAITRYGWTTKEEDPIIYWLTTIIFFLLAVLCFWRAY